MAPGENKKDGGCLVVLTRCQPGRDDEFNQWYDEVHVPELCAMGPFTGARRYRVSDQQLFDQTHQYLAIYEYTGPAEEAHRALVEAGGKLTMSDALDADSPFMTLVEPI